MKESKALGPPLLSPLAQQHGLAEANDISAARSRRRAAWRSTCKRALPMLFQGEGTNSAEEPDWDQKGDRIRERGRKQQAANASRRE
jgi:hypothetical protein